MVASARGLASALMQLTHPEQSKVPRALVEQLTDPAAACPPGDHQCARNLDDDERRRQGDDAYALGLRRTFSPRGDVVLRFGGRTGDFTADLAARADGTVAIAVLGNDGTSYGATVAAAVW